MRSNNLWLGSQDEDEEVLDEEPREILTRMETRNILHSFQNKVECSGCDYDLMLSPTTLEYALLLSSKNTRQTQLIPFSRLNELIN